MTWESWFKVGLPALPALWAVFGLWGYWGENPIPLLAPAVAYWGVVVVYYLFGRVYAPKTYSPFWLAVFTVLLWFISSITSHHLSKFLALSTPRITQVIANRDFLYAYVCAVLSACLGLWQFLRHEPKIVERDRIQREVE